MLTNSVFRCVISSLLPADSNSLLLACPATDPRVCALRGCSTTLMLVCHMPLPQSVESNHRFGIHAHSCSPPPCISSLLPSTRSPAHRSADWRSISWPSLPEHFRPWAKRHSLPFFCSLRIPIVRCVYSLQLWASQPTPDCCYPGGFMLALMFRHLNSC